MVAEPPIAKLNHLQQMLYTMPKYAELKPSSKQVKVILCNLSSRKVTFNWGEVVASLAAANAVPKMLASKNPEKVCNSDS